MPLPYRDADDRDADDRGTDDRGTDGSAVPRTIDGATPWHRARTELDLGLTGRLLDSLNTLSWGLLAGSGIGSWITLCLGMTEAFGTDARISDHITRNSAGGFFVAIGVFYVLAITVSAARTLYYAKRVGEATRSPDSILVADYQADTAVGSTKMGKAFFGWYALAIIVICVGAFMAIAAISFLIEGEGGESILIATGASVAFIVIGIVLIRLVKRARSLRARRCPEDPRHKRAPTPTGARRVPSPAPRAHRITVRVQTITLNLVFIVLLAGIIAFVVWGALSGHVVMVGGRVRALPDSIKSELTPADLDAQGVIAIVLAASALGGALLLLVVIILGGVRRVIALRTLLPYATAADVGMTRPLMAVSVDALTYYSGARRATGVVGAIGALLFVAAATPLSTVDSRVGATMLVSIGVLAIAVTVAIDVGTQPRSRATRNAIFAAWPSAHAFTNRLDSNPAKKSTKKSKA